MSVRDVLNALPMQIAILDHTGGILTVNQAWRDGIGSHLPVTEGANYFHIWQASNDPQAEAARAAIPAVQAVLQGEQSAVSFEYSRIENIDAHWLLVRVMLLTGGPQPRVLVAFDDITDRKRLESLLQSHAFYDALTGLPNRAFLFDRLHQAVSPVPSPQSSVAFLLMDLDNFKEVNDSFGHHIGDLLLRQVAERLHQAAPDPNILARLGGDEFAVLIQSVDGVESGVAMAHRLLSVLEAPFTLGELSINVQASIGIAYAAGGDADPQTLLRQADVAMYTAKRSRIGSAVYHPEHDHYSPDRHALITELRQAIEQGQLCLYFQPQVAIGARQVSWVEALVRWRHPQRGLTPPGDFIPLAEETGLIHPLTLWVLNEALRQAAEWRRNGEPLGVAVNFSARDFADSRLLEQVAILLKHWDISPGALKIEITESAIMENPDRAVAELGRLRELGIELAIDDFGTGYSSMAYLANLPITEVKIDKTFVQGVGSRRSDTIITQCVIELAHSLGLQVIAEGVETREVLEQLAAWSCDFAQGYYLSRPIPAAELIQWLHESPLLAPPPDRRLRVIAVHGVCPRGYGLGNIFTYHPTGEISPELCPTALATLLPQIAAMVRGAKNAPRAVTCPIYDHMLAMQLEEEGS